MATLWKPGRIPWATGAGSQAQQPQALRPSDVRVPRLGFVIGLTGIATLLAKMLTGSLIGNILVVYWSCTGRVLVVYWLRDCSPTRRLSLKTLHPEPALRHRRFPPAQSPSPLERRQT